MMTVLNKMKTFISATLLSLVVIGCATETQTLRVGAKPFSESMILAEMIAQLAENAGIAVERNIPYGPTQQIMEATKQDVIDVYPEYNGTGLIFLGQAPTSDGEASTATVQELFKPMGLEMTGKFGFSNDYAMVMTAERAQELSVKTLEDLARLADPITYAVDEDFVQRPADGLQQMNRRYGINDSSVTTFPLGTEGKDQIVSALLDGSADVGELFMTDGQIAEYGLVVLEDNLKFFPVYEVAPLVRSSALANIAGLSDVLGQLVGAISAEDMQAMNKAVDLDAQTPASVAAEFLVAKGLLPEGAGGTDVQKLMVAADPGVGRGSETARALRAIRAGFSGSDLEISNSADPLASLADGSARIAMVGAESFYSVGDDGPVAKGNAEAFAVLGYKTAHLFANKNGARSISDMKKIATDAAGTGSAAVLEMILNSLGLDDVEIVNSDGDLRAQTTALANGEVDGVFAMATQGSREIKSALGNSAVELIGLDEWAQGGHTARYSFIRPSTIAAQTYRLQFQPIASVSTQQVLASPVQQALAAGEVGPGTTGTDVSTAVPVGADAVNAIRDAIDSSEVVDPALPVHAALVPEIEVVDASLPFSLDVSIVNIIMIIFTVWVLYLCFLPSPPDFKLPDDK